MAQQRGHGHNPLPGKRSRAMMSNTRRRRWLRIAGRGLIFVSNRQSFSAKKTPRVAHEPSLRDQSPLVAIHPMALDDPLGAIDTTHGRMRVSRAKERLRRAGFVLADRHPRDPSMSSDRPMAMFYRVWRGVVWVVLASWDGSLAYRVPVAHFDPEDPLMVAEPDALPDETPEAIREYLRSVRWTTVGLFLDVVDAVLALPNLREHSHFPSAREAS
ncbi:hypothetical protein [Umezawaea sp. Da 62-37]|uniref:hypothetical protein n=1 Tax=Umezawaea sp. Da 62-37 TaxID=3075927 RepID=UPI0028F7303F|nr:hypothetical protein [Umezawaea sp. Da 62-37]WNV83068.1 hypothetical protein RM788_33420 [Umezawaea sp. Da 62-37]